MSSNLLTEVQQNIHGAISDHQKNPTKTVLDYFLLRCLSFYSKPVGNMVELKKKNGTKVKGDIFELFTYVYFQHVVGLKQVWLLADAPDQVLKKLSLRRNDVGIDVIGIDEHGGYHAVQAKYRKRTFYKSKVVLGWKQLSTFFALVSRTGPFVKHWVFTNADYCRRFGRRTPQDRSICYQGLCGISHYKWLEMAGSSGYTIGDSPPKEESLIETEFLDDTDGKVDDEDLDYQDDLDNKELDDDKLSDDKLSDDKLSVQPIKKKLTFKKIKPVGSLGGAEKNISLEEMRAIRLAYFSNPTKIPS